MSWLGPKPKHPVINGMKCCIDCLVILPESYFYERRRGDSPTIGRIATCIDCTNAKQRERYTVVHSALPRSRVLPTYLLNHEYKRWITSRVPHGT